MGSGKGWVDAVPFISFGWTTAVERGKECLWFARYSYVAENSPVRIVKIRQNGEGFLIKTVWKFLDDMVMISAEGWAHKYLVQATAGEVDSWGWKDVIRSEEWESFL